MEIWITNRKYKWKLKRILELKSIIKKNLLEEFKDRYEQAVERNSKLKDRTMEIIKLEELKEKILKKSEKNLRNMLDII